MPLTDTLTGIANAIRTKDGTTAPIPFLDMPQRVLDIPSGGGPVEVKEKDINFFDYDGTLLYSYTLAEAAALTELPPGPEHERLVFQQWSWSLDGLKSAGRGIDVGAYYTTRSGNVEIDIELNERTGLRQVLRFNGTSGAYKVNINWGDGSPIATYGSIVASGMAHMYQEAGSYTISLIVDDIDKLSLLLYGASTGAVYTNMFGASPNYSVVGIYLCQIRGLNSYCFYDCENLKYVTLPPNILNGNYALTNCYSLKHFTALGATNGLVQNCYSLKRLIVPEKDNFEATSVGVNTAIERFTFSDATTAISTMVNTTRQLKEITIGSKVTQIKSSAFANCLNLKSITILATTPPTIAAANAISTIPNDCCIRVPKGSLGAYQAASIWSTRASQMEEIE